MEIIFEVPQETKNRLTLWPHYPTLCFIVKGVKSISRELLAYLCLLQLSSQWPNSGISRGVQQPMNDKENVVCIHIGVLYSHKEE
jgi:hypothetical protein